MRKMYVPFLPPPAHFLHDHLILAESNIDAREIILEAGDGHVSY